MNVYSIFDSTSAVFGDPIICTNDADAIRSFSYALSNPKYPNYIRLDSVLYCLGTFDRETGMFKQDVPPYVVFRGSNVIVRKDDCYEE